METALPTLELSLGTFDFFGGGRCYLARRPMAEGSWGRNSKQEPSCRGHRGMLLTSLLSLLSYSAQAHLSRGSTTQ